MFGGSKKPERPKRTNRNLAQYGLFDPTAPGADFNIGLGGADDANDSDLEAELAALTGGGGAAAPPKRKPPSAAATANLNALIAQSLKDDEDEEDDGDDDDPDLLNELTEITGGDDGETSEAQSPVSSGSADNGLVTMLNDRLKMYEDAERHAKSTNETSKARRYNRAIKTIKDQIKQASSGRPVNESDIPPEVAIPTKKVAPPVVSENTSPATSPTTSDDNVKETPQPAPKDQPDNSELISTLTARRNEYKMAALAAKKNGDTATSIKYVKIGMQFDRVIQAVEEGREVDLSAMPPPPPAVPEVSRPAPPPPPQIEENKIQTQTPQSDEIGEGSEENLIGASSVAEALQQRLEVYKKQQDAAAEQNNASKARRMGRVVKQFEQAIKLHSAGKPILFDDLPTPPGYAPIPGSVPKTTSPEGAAAQPQPSSSQQQPQPPSQKTTRLSGNKAPNSKSEQQLVILLSKQKEFKLAALRAKNKGEMEQAKEYLRTAKGFEPLIEAVSCGLPIDVSSIPVSPSAKSQLDNEYDIVMADDCAGDTEENPDSDLIARLETQLSKQLKMCLTTRDHHKALGDVAGANRFERLAINVTKDLDVVRLVRKTPGARVPKFHYENRDFAIVKSFTELGDNDLELSVLRGISYTCANPKDIDTYVKVEFPFPQEEPFRDKTATVKDTNSPEYNANFTIPIQRTSRACQRVFKRHSVKFEVYSKGSGFFRGDTLIGTAMVKLQPLETQCELHDSFDLLEGRKKVGGKLEVRMRLRHPIVAQEVEQIQEKWLTIDS